MPEYRVTWPDGHVREVEAEKVKHARRRAIARREHDDGYVTGYPDEYLALDVQVVRDTENDACLVKQAKDGGWWLVINDKWTTAPAVEPLNAPCPHCAKPIKVEQKPNDNLPGRPFVLWEFKDRDDAEGLATMVNVMILAACMRSAHAEEEAKTAA